MQPKCYSVIIAGGKGTRFWPLSRSARPKQLLKILGRRSLISETVSRVLPISGRKQTLVVTIAEQLRALQKELRNLPRGNFLAEPQGKNTAPCIGLAALEIANRDANATMVVLPADHWVRDINGFRNVIRSAVKIATDSENLITIGIQPNYPETGYGYIVKGKSLGGDTAAHQVRRFREKPSVTIAERLIRHGALWNSGIFVWKAATLLQLLHRYEPKISQALEVIKKTARGGSLGAPKPQLRAMIAREYRTMPNVSIDYAVLEKAGSEGKVITLEANFGWSDVGSWAAVHRMLPHDEHGNAGSGKWLAWGAKNSLIHASDRLVALLGVANTVIVDTPDALLVGDMRRSQEVRELVAELNRKGYGAYTIK
ncbi:MAG TPA: sugar phosphate nucleotidyltransferase [Candidatus Binatia bacterium]|jgi:mannose-1-phosphate guanylyltransferase